MREIIIRYATGNSIPNYGTCIRSGLIIRQDAENSDSRRDYASAVDFRSFRLFSPSLGAHEWSSNEILKRTFSPILNANDPYVTASPLHPVTS